MLLRPVIRNFNSYVMNFQQVFASRSLPTPARRIIPKHLKNDIHSFPAGSLAHGVENKPVNLLVVFLGNTFNGMPPFLFGRQVVGPNLTKD